MLKTWYGSHMNVGFASTFRSRASYNVLNNCKYLDMRMDIQLTLAINQSYTDRVYLKALINDNKHTVLIYAYINS